MTIALRPDNRLFLAADPPDRARGRLAALARLATDRWGGRPVPPENLHATLCFLGRVDPAAAPELARAVAGLGAAAGPAAARITCLTGTPGRRASPVCAAGLADHGGLATLFAEALRHVPTAAGITPADHPPWAHVTVARFRRPTPLVAFPMDDEQVFVFDRVTLYDAHMVHGGAPRYVPVTGTRLGTVHSL
jgi:2'-5' RNA ligase